MCRPEIVANAYIYIIVGSNTIAHSLTYTGVITEGDTTGRMRDWWIWDAWWSRGINGGMQFVWEPCCVSGARTVNVISIVLVQMES